MATTENVMTDLNKPSPATERLLLRVPEAASLLSLGQSTVHRLIRQGRLRAVKIDRSTRITRSELDSFLQGLGGSYADAHPQ